MALNGLVIAEVPIKTPYEYASDDVDFLT